MKNKKNQFISLFFLLMCLESLFSQEHPVNFQYDGSLLFRTYYLSRDILTQKQTQESCPNPIEVYKNPDQQPNTRCKEKKDQQRIRFRLNMQFFPNPYTNIYYGIEVGDIIFGSEKTDKIGPGSGGSGSGATNIETRELRLTLHTIDKSTIFDVGIFPYSTPYGLVLASSGAGIRIQKEIPFFNSKLESVYFKLQDNSFTDGDANGFSDENYQDVELLVLKYKFFIFSKIIPELYFVYKRDPVKKDSNGDPKDTYQFYWSGLYLEFSHKNWNIFVNIVNQQGYLLSETKIIPDDYFLQTFFSQIYQQIQNINSAYPSNRKKYPKNAYAGNLEISYNMDRYKFSFVATGATGRLGMNNDNTDPAYNIDQYKSAGGSFQFSEIGIDASGGYSLYKVDQLAGIYSYGIKLQYQLIQGLIVEPQFFVLKTHKTPSIDYNQFFNRENFKNPTNHLGDEWNLRITYKPWLDFYIKIHIAYLNTGEAYKTAYDIKNGDSLREYSIYIQQKF